MSRKSSVGSVWAGPQSDRPGGGITFSLLNRFICCRERFRVHVVEGLRPAEGFNYRIEYGNMWHVCEEHHAAGTDWQAPLGVYARSLCSKYPTEQSEVLRWYNICLVQFPVYVRHWARVDQPKRTPLLSEQVFSVPYLLPSGRTVYLRGKWDSVDLSGKEVFLQENKTKGDVRPDDIARQLKFDLQTMIYMVALDWQIQNPLKGPSHYESLVGLRGKLAGVRYNVVKRPLSGGAGTIRQQKPSKSNPSGETLAEFYSRLGVLIEEYATQYFMRWEVRISPDDVLRFKRECLDPLLEQLCDWWEYMLANGPIIDPYSDVWSFNKHGIHWRHPYGCYNALDERGAHELDAYVETGDRTGLVRSTDLFPELGGS